MLAALGQLVSRTVPEPFDEADLGAPGAALADAFGDDLYLVSRVPQLAGRRGHPVHDGSVVKLRVVRGTIVGVVADAVVTAGNSRLIGGTGVNGDIQRGGRTGAPAGTSAARTVSAPFSRGHSSLPDDEREVGHPRGRPSLRRSAGCGCWPTRTRRRSRGPTGWGRAPRRSRPAPPASTAIPRRRRRGSPSRHCAERRPQWKLCCAWRVARGERTAALWEPELEATRTRGPCPHDGTDTAQPPRYPQARCATCAGRVTDLTGRAVRLYNTSLSGGFEARHDEDETICDQVTRDGLVLVEEKPHSAAEARSGGTVVHRARAEPAATPRPRPPARSPRATQFRLAPGALRPRTGSRGGRRIH